MILPQTTIQKKAVFEESSTYTACTTRIVKFGISDDKNPITIKLSIKQYQYPIKVLYMLDKTVLMLHIMYKKSVMSFAYHSIER